MTRSAHGLVRSAQRHVTEAATQLGLAVAALQAIDGFEAGQSICLDHLIASMTAHKHLVANHCDLMMRLDFLETENSESGGREPLHCDGHLKVSRSSRA